MRLNQVLQLQRDKKEKAYKVASDVYKEIQKAPRLIGSQRIYNKINDETEDLPPETVPMPTNSLEQLALVIEKEGDAWDYMAMRDYGNLNAVADVTVEGLGTILTSAPVTLLLAMEKQLSDMRDVIAKLPILDSAHTWEWSDDQGCFVSDAQTTNRSTKEPRVVTKVSPSEHGEGQADIIMQDRVVGHWITTFYSTAFRSVDRQAALDRVDAVRAAIKIAREEANSVDVAPVEFGVDLLNFIFDPVFPARQES